MGEFVRTTDGAAFVFSSWLVLAQGAKRCHDKGVNGWWQLLPFYVLVLLFYRGDIGANEYGKDPKSVGYDGKAVYANKEAEKPIDDDK